MAYHILLILSSLFISLSHAIVLEGGHIPYLGQCPTSCYRAGPDRDNWSRYHRLKDLEPCEHRTLLLDFSAPLSSDSVSTFRACAASAERPFRIGIPFLAAEYTAVEDDSSSGSSQDSVNASTICGAQVREVKVTPRVDTVASHRTGRPIKKGDVNRVANAFAAYIETAESCGTTSLFAKSGNMVVGLFAGSGVSKTSAAALIKKVKAVELHGQVTSLQICQDNNSTHAEARTVGVYVTTLDRLDDARAAIKVWADGTCFTTKASSSFLPVTNMDFLVSKYGHTSSKGSRSLSRRHHVHLHSLQSRGDCHAIQVRSNDTCASLASKCKISGTDFTKFNKNYKLCSGFTPNQWVCCSAGTLPNVGPKAGTNGTCHTYTLKAKDTCSAIGGSWKLTESDIEEFNKKTWGWSGCDHIKPGQRICLSKGNPPMPAPLPGAVCGPQASGNNTKPLAPGGNLTNMNPCPLNACCNVSGKCGTTSDFCTVTSSPTGAPGTAKPGTSGCIQNCGTKILNNNKAPSQFYKIGYYEAFNKQRSCLNMDVNSIDTSNYTHIHFAFATVDAKFQPEIRDSPIQFKEFTKLKGVKKILSLGGWAFSTDKATFQKFRQATDGSHRQHFVSNLVQFMKDHSIDGFDFDWEYTGAADMPDTPPGSPSEGQNILDFLTLLRKQLPSDKSISVAVPASYGYLKAYPISKIASVVDYLTYMTYDLHGQWDMGNKMAVPGCARGDCLRSHVNKTETYNALAMVTKAGVPSTKLVVGVSSYGRGFRMTSRNCSSPTCTYQGKKGAPSPTYPGMCTNTSGYISNAEIKEIIENPGGMDVKTSYDKDSDSNILIYGTDNKYDWVAYMDGATKANRTNWYKSLNFAGVADWAVDLQDYTGDTPGDNNTEPFVIDLDWDYMSKLGCDSEDNPGDLQKLVDNMDNIPGICHDKYLVDILAKMLDEAIGEFRAVADSHYDEQFKYYAKWVKDGINTHIRDFMAYGTGEGNKYFDCDYQAGNKKGSSSCMGMPHVWEQKMFSTDITYHLRDKKGFFDALEAKHSIQEEWVKFGDSQDNWECGDDSSDSTSNGGSQGGYRTQSEGGHHNESEVGFHNETEGGYHAESAKCRQIFHYKHNFPQRVDGDKVQVGDPKKLIEASMPNITHLRDVLAASSVSLGLHTYDAGGGSDSNVSTHDPANAASMPVLQLMQSVDSMREIKKIGQEAEEAQKKNLILQILSVVLMVIPFVGEELGPLVGSATQVARVAAVIGEVGNAALTVADIVEDPSSAPFAILGLLGEVGAAAKGAGKEAKVMAEAAAARKGLKKGDLDKFSESFRKNDGLVQRVIKACPKS